MYEFIRMTHPECKITEKDLRALERKYEIVFPQPLFDFYLAYNGAECSLSEWEKEGEYYQVHVFLPIYKTAFKIPTIETCIEWDRMDGYIPRTMIPFALDQGGDTYYCDSQTGKIFLVSHEDIDDPIELCESFSEFVNNLSVVDKT